MTIGTMATGVQAPEAQALRLITKRRDFKAHAFLYVLVSTLIWGVWLVVGLTTHSWWPWAAAVSVAWGVGLAAHGFEVYVRHGSIEADVREEMERLSQARR